MCTKVSNEDDLKWKETSNGKWPQNMRIRISQPRMVGSYSNLKLKLMGMNQSTQRHQMKMTSNGRWLQMEDDLKWKMTSNGRWPQNMRSRIYQPPPVGSYSYLKLEVRGRDKTVYTYGIKQNCTKIWNENDLKWKTPSNGRWPQMEDDLKLKMTSKY